MSKENIKKQIYIGTIIFYIYIFFYNRKTLLKTKTGQNKIAKGLSTNLLICLLQDYIYNSRKAT